MTNKTYVLTLGGQDETLLFGKLGFYFYINKALGIDPIEWFGKIGSEENGVIKNISDVAAIVYAGLNTFNDVNNKPEVSFERVQKWVNGLETSEMAALVSFAFNAFSVEVEKKVEAPQENPLPGMK